MSTNPWSRYILQRKMYMLVRANLDNPGVDNCIVDLGIMADDCSPDRIELGAPFNFIGANVPL